MGIKAHSYFWIDHLGYIGASAFLGAFDSIYYQYFTHIGYSYRSDDSFGGPASSMGGIAMALGIFFYRLQPTYSLDGHASKWPII